MEEEAMAEGNSALKPNSGAGWTFPPMPFPGASFPGQPHLAEQTARASLMGLEMMETWLTASRQMIDLWRTSVRESQDGMFAAYRSQIVNSLAHDLLEQLEAPSRAATKRQPATKAAVAKTDGAKPA
jgi:hypothetical protein